MSQVYVWQEAPKADFAVIGDPVGHSLSPRMHMAAFEALALPYRYVAVHVPAAEVAPALDHLRERGYRGVNVTVPNKAAVFDWSREPDAFTSRLGVANTLDLPSGRATNTDGPGFLDTLLAAGIPPGARVLLLGAGGAARAAALAMAETGYDLSIFNRTRTRAESLVHELGLRSEVLDEPRGFFDLIVNATSAGLAGETPAFDWGSSPPGVAYDMHYGKEPTPFLRAATRLGWRGIDGRPLLVAQGARSFSWWLGVPAPLDVMAEAVA